MDDKHVRTPEELSLNNWQPLSTLLYDGWILRFAEGYTKRANSVNPIHQSTLDLLPTIFKITPLAQPSHLDRILEKKGYALVEPTSVRTLSLNRLREPRMDSVRIEKTPNTGWLENFCRINQVDNLSRRTLERMLSNIRSQTGYVSIFARIGLLPADSA